MARQNLATACMDLSMVSKAIPLYAAALAEHRRLAGGRDVDTLVSAVGTPPRTVQLSL
jgi:hypothetical protein